MTTSQAIISGIVQGITEFFPISSSGHLAILHSLFGFKQPMLAFDVFLHFGTLVSIVVFFWKDIINILQKDRTLLKFIILGSIPTFIIGILFKDMVESFFAAPHLIGYFLVSTGIFLLFASFSAIYWKMTRRSRPLGVVNSIIIGIAQGISVLPGISRSGVTIGTALIAGMDEDLALKFSLILALPAVLGANILKAGQICGNLVSIEAVSFIAGGLAAMLTGFFAIKFLFIIVRKNMFFLFGVYCILIGWASIVLRKPR